MHLRVLLALILAALGGCSSEPVDHPIFVECPETHDLCPDPLRINELMAKNEGAWIDEVGETDDWIELINTGDEPVSLAGYRITDDPDEAHDLPEVSLEPGEVLVLWADGEPGEGALHLPFKLSAEGERVYLIAPDGRLVDRVSFEAQEPNASVARMPDGDGRPRVCEWATPARLNGDTCGPPPPPELPIEVEFEDYAWPAPWPEPPTPLAITELALRPAAFIEVLNVSADPVELSRYALALADTAPGRPLPTELDGVTLAWPVASLEPGERVVVPVTEADTATIEATGLFEGVASLFESGVDEPVDRVDFMEWPEGGSALARVPDATGGHRFCATPTPGEASDPCEPVPSRAQHGRLHHLYTPGDFAALAEGETTLGTDAVKFIVDMDAGDVVHLLSNRAWDLHYTFIRELIDGDEHLDRCDPEQNEVFHAGWVQFSQEQYFTVEGRRYLLGTLVHNAGVDLWTVEFATGDRISGEQMLRAFFALARHVHFPEPLVLNLRPQGDDQVAQMLTIDGQAPIVDENAPFRGMTFQPLSEGVAYGVLTFVPAGDLMTEPLGPQVVVVTDQVPNDLPMVGGLITEVFQTPLAHVNVLSHNRGTPNMALVDARDDPRVAPLLDTLVRLEVLPGGFELRTATPEEAEEFWASRVPQGDPLRPSLDTSVRGIQLIADLGLADLGAVGAKAALLAELIRVLLPTVGGDCTAATPENAFAIPLVHFVEHFEASGAASLLAEARADPEFRVDPRARDARLREIRDAIMAHPVDPELLAEVEAQVAASFDGPRVRFRSSSNNEDLEGFNGAGLYTSVSAGEGALSVEDAIRTVWASLYNTRAYDERTYFNVDEASVAMGILVHEAYLSERANGVVISRNVLNPIRSDQYYVNAQVGEASVTNPAPGVTTEQFIFRRGRTPRLVYYARSSLPGGEQVVGDEEAETLACVVRQIHNGFAELFDPEGEDRWFAVDIEFKFVGPDRQLVVKQARPYAFSSTNAPTDCREF